MGFLTILRKQKIKDKEVRLLMLYDEEDISYLVA